MVKIGILGAGRVTQNRYIDVFQNELHDVSVELVCDPVKEKADTVAGALGARSVYDEADIFAESAVDVVLICTESGNHYSQSKKAILAGKHVITEKPPAMLPAQVLEIETLAKEHAVMYAPIFQNRYNPAMKQLKQTFEEGRFGKLTLATIRLRWCRYQDYYEDGWHGTWAMDGGVINQQAIHHIDALQWVCGPIARVCATQSNALNSLEAEDTMAAIVEFESGTLGVIEATTAARPEDFEASMSVVGEGGMVQIGGIALNLIDQWTFIEARPEDNAIPTNYSQEVPTGYGLSHGPLMQDIIDRLNNGQIDPPITGSDTVSTVQLVHALYASVEQDGWVNLADHPLSSRLGKR